MVVVNALKRFLLLFGLLGLLLAPATTGTAMAAMVVSAAPQMDMALIADDDMPCCPEEQPVKQADCGKPCPLALICSTSLLGNFGSAATWTVAVTQTDMLFEIPRDRLHLSAIPEPPARPPRT